MNPNSDAALRRLERIKHIVVLMMENRSFDQMLGYLGLEGGIEGVDGLQHARVNYDAQGNGHEVFEWGIEQTSFHPPQDHSGKILDPCHSPACVKEQLAEDNRGFVKNFLATRRDSSGKPVAIPEEYHGLPLGYYTDRHLPVYDFLARQFCVCDAWHSSIPGDTWPNRLYALAGGEGPKVHFGPLERLVARITGRQPSVPIYEVEAFTRQLENGQWRWYSHDPATLRGADKRYRNFDLRRGNFAYFDRKKVSDITQALEDPIVTHDSFLDDAANPNQLRDVSWIDPNFIDLHILDPVSNDDHPPSDVRAGQALVLDTYNALANTEAWEDTLLVVCYDEHGGFYDHVVPPPVAADDHSAYSTYGVRVPALVVGPRVKQTVCHEPFDHTTLIKTILLRFAADPERALASMPKRVQDAPHLGVVLEDEPRRNLPGHEHLHELLDRWREQARAERRTSGSGTSKAGDGAGHRFEPNDFQEEFARFIGTLRKKGLPGGQP
jgi:phospholipase C